MKAYWLLAMCLACSSQPTNDKPDAAPQEQDAALENLEESGSNDAEADVIEEVPSQYQACVSRWSVLTSYSRLTAIYCTDSTGYTYLDGFWDNQLFLMCSWKTASDYRVRCLPQNDQSAVLYDEQCVQPVSLAAINKDGSWVEPFIGIEQLGDAGRYLADYQIGDPYPGNQFSFRTEDLDSGTFQCYATAYVWRVGLGMFYLGAEQDPSIFVER